MAWRRDLDYAITCYERDQDLERARAELSPKDQRTFDSTFGSSSLRSGQRLMQGGVLTSGSGNSELMRKLRNGPVSRAEALRMGGRAPW